MISRTGKIARLPATVREQVNHRLLDGQPGPALLAWLNGVPEVQSVLVRQFGGRPVSKQNLSQWRCRGFAEWQLRREIVDSAHRLAAAERMKDEG